MMNRRGDGGGPNNNGGGPNGGGAGRRPCAACRRFRQRCPPNCPFAPYFPPEQQEEFDNVHRVFGARSVRNLLASLNPNARANAMESIKWQAEMRRLDPEFGAMGVINNLRTEVEMMEREREMWDREMQMLLREREWLQRELQQHPEQQQQLPQFRDFLPSGQPHFGGFQNQNPAMINPSDEAHAIGNMRNLDPGHSYSPPPNPGYPEGFNRVNNFDKAHAIGNMRNLEQGYNYPPPPNEGYPKGFNRMNDIDESHAIGNMRNLDQGYKYPPPPNEGYPEGFNPMNGNYVGESRPIQLKMMNRRGGGGGPNNNGAAANNNGRGAGRRTCAACRRFSQRCPPNCPFAPYFPPEQQEEFDKVHRVFGARSVRNLLASLNPNARENAMESVKWLAEMRHLDPEFDAMDFIINPHVEREMWERARKDRERTSAASRATSTISGFFVVGVSHVLGGFRTKI
ncbi:uncharacterized protein LOC143891977 [Tasmannia lanceolata]|uniref:uncharacterized protein LOC143891977 n=1 Tax=Tasmannia lanceolata TaxID=3420 RepID=UPI0040643974